MDIDIQLLMYKSIFMYVAKDHVLHSRENISVHRCFTGFYEYICDTLINIVDASMQTWNTQRSA